MVAISKRDQLVMLLFVSSLDLRSVQGHHTEGKLDVKHAELVRVCIIRCDSNDRADCVFMFGEGRAANPLHLIADFEM
jgi:hypothetical protein